MNEGPASNQSSIVYGIGTLSLFVGIAILVVVVVGVASSLTDGADAGLATGDVLDFLLSVYVSGSAIVGGVLIRGRHATVGFMVLGLAICVFVVAAISFLLDIGRWGP